MSGEGEGDGEGKGGGGKEGRDGGVEVLLLEEGTKEEKEGRNFDMP